MQLQVLDPGDPVVGHPFLAAAIRARYEQPMQDAGENSALDSKLKSAIREQLAQHLGNAEPSPEPPKQQWPANAGAGDAARRHVGQDDRAIAMSRQRSGQTLQFAARQQHVLAAERADDALADAAALALTLDEVEIGVASGRLLADVHPMCWPHVRQSNQAISIDITANVALHYWTRSENRPSVSRQINHLPDRHPCSLFKLGHG